MRTLLVRQTQGSRIAFCVLQSPPVKEGKKSGLLFLVFQKKYERNAFRQFPRYQIEKKRRPINTGMEGNWSECGGGGNLRLKKTLISEPVLVASPCACYWATGSNLGIYCFGMGARGGKA